MAGSAPKTEAAAAAGGKGKRRKKMFEKSMFSATPRVRPDTRPCQWPGCEDLGEHRAPHSRQQLDSYRWFCLDHVRRYNRAWNYYEGMNDQEVESDLRRDTTWNRPSWPLGAEKSFRSRGEGIQVDDFGAFGDPGQQYEGPHGEPQDGQNEADQRRFSVRPKPDSPAALALAVFDLRAPVTISEIKARYKELVKRHHPDANGGAKGAEEKFKRVGQAYQTLIAELSQ